MAIVRMHDYDPPRFRLGDGLQISLVAVQRVWLFSKPQSRQWLLLFQGLIIRNWQWRPQQGLIIRNWQ